MEEPIYLGKDVEVYLERVPWEKDPLAHVRIYRTTILRNYLPATVHELDRLIKQLQEAKQVIEQAHQALKEKKANE